MNILPKKRWHVRTKDNIARVRRDEANAAKEEKEIQRRAQLAEQEARTNYLREKASDRIVSDGGQTSTQVALIAGAQLEHVSFISESEKEQKKWGANKEREEEVKQEKEKYEKSIGLLTYLGQSVLDSKGEQPWYLTKKKTEADNAAQDEKAGSKSKSKNLFDPLNDMKKYLKMIDPQGDSTSVTPKRPSIAPPRPSVPEASSFIIAHSNRKHSKKKSKKSKKKKTKSSRKRKRSFSESSSDSSGDRKAHMEREQKNATLERLRSERLLREREERVRADKLLARARGETAVLETKPQSPPRDGRQKYNSQFNPHLAKKPRLEI